MARRLHLPWAVRPARPDVGRAGGAVRGSGDPDAWLDDDASPPECPPGWRTGPPDFVGVGAQKAGTTWWFTLLTAHPDVHETGGQRPELHFLDRFVTGWPGPDDVERYHRFFPRPPGAMAGEKTPIYMACHWVPRMLRDAAPETRPIVLLRDPIARYVSGRTHEDARLARVHRGVRDPANEVRWVSDAFAKGLSTHSNWAGCTRRSRASRSWCSLP